MAKEPVSDGAVENNRTIERVPAGWVRVRALEDDLILDPRKPRGKKGDTEILPKDIAEHLGARVEIIEKG